MERSYRTWQGRFPQELRLRQIRTVEQRRLHGVLFSGFWTENAIGGFNLPLCQTLARSDAANNQRSKARMSPMPASRMGRSATSASPKRAPISEPKYRS